MPTLSYQPHSV